MLELIGLAATTGILTTLLNQGATVWREGRHTRKDAAYLALRLAVLLERFAAECWGLIGDVRDHESSQGQIGNITKTLPTLAPFPEDVSGWKSLNQWTASKILEIPQRALSAQQGIDFLLDVSDFEDAVEEACKQAAALGYTAWLLASELRRLYGFPAFIPPFSYHERLAEGVGNQADEIRHSVAAPALLPRLRFPRAKDRRDER